MSSKRVIAKWQLPASSQGKHSSCLGEVERPLPNGTKVDDRYLVCGFGADIN